MLQSVRNYLNERKPLMITADAFKILINKYNCADALFQKYFLYFLNIERKNIKKEIIGRRFSKCLIMA